MEKIEAKIKLEKKKSITIVTGAPIIETKSSDRPPLVSSFVKRMIDITMAAVRRAGPKIAARKLMIGIALNMTATPMQMQAAVRSVLWGFGKVGGCTKQDITIHLPLYQPESADMCLHPSVLVPSSAMWERQRFHIKLKMD